MNANYGHFKASMHLAVYTDSLYKKRGVFEKTLLLKAKIQRVQLFSKGPLHFAQVLAQILLSKH